MGDFVCGREIRDVFAFVKVRWAIPICKSARSVANLDGGLPLNPTLRDLRLTYLKRKIKWCTDESDHFALMSCPGVCEHPFLDVEQELS
jgi:hypothetical protein